MAAKLTKAFAGFVGGQRNGVKEREKVAELPPGLDELWGGEEQAWSFVRQ